MPYVTQSLDTTEAAERAQIKVLRRLGPGKRLEMMRNLSKRTIRMSWSALQRANPGLSERQLQVKAVALWYGEKEAIRLEAALKEKGLWN
jgi:hypothetical protein